jgi:ABC-type phosphate transport system substrate-binding protein
VTADQRAADFLDPQSVDLVIRLGQSDNLASSAYQIGSDDLLVIVNQHNPIKQLTASKVQGLFSGQIQNWKEAGGSDAAVQVWAYAAAEDLQLIFDQAVLGGNLVASTARLASSPDEMIQAILTDVNAIGILNRRLSSSNVSEVYFVTTMPVLALTKRDPQGSLNSILACLQKKS